MTDVYAVVSHPGPIEASVLSDLSPTFTVRRQAIANVTLRSLETEGPPKAAAGPPVVLIHGRGQAATTWFPLLPELARRGPVIALDLPGFGHSASIPFRGGSPEDGLRFFVDPVEALLIERGLQGAAIVGHSLGGFIAAELALRGAVQPSKLVLIGGMGLGPAMSYASRAFFLAGPERVIRFGGPRLLHLLDPYPDTPTCRRIAALAHELYAVRGGRPDASAAFNALFPSLGPAFNRFERLGSITCPTLLLWGQNDAVFPTSVAEKAAAQMPNATLRVEPLGHAPHLEDTTRILPLLTSFLYPAPSVGPRAP